MGLDFTFALVSEYFDACEMLYCHKMSIIEPID